MTRTTIYLMGVLLVLAGCLPTAKKQSCSTGNVFNPTSRSCVPITSGGIASGVNISAKSPIVSNLTVAATQTAASQFSVTVADPLSSGYTLYWKLFPPTGVTFSGNPVASNTATYNLVPNTIGMTPGLWTLAAEVYDSSATTLVTSAQWAVTVTSNPTPTLSIHAGSSLQSTTGSRSTTDTATTYLAVSVTDTAPTPTSWTLNWYYDGVLMKTGSSSGSKNPATHASTFETFFSTLNALSNDNPPLASGQHLIRAELRNGASIYSTLEWTIYVSPPNLPQVSTVSPPAPDTSTTIIAINGIALNASGFRESIGLTNIYPTDDFCVAVNDYDGSRNDAPLQTGAVSVVWKVNGASVTTPVYFTANNSARCLGDAGILPTFALSLANSAIGEFKTVNAVITDIDSNTVVATVSWGVSVRPKNTPPVVTIVSPVGSPVIRLQDITETYTITVDDEDTTNTDNMGITFFFDGVAMDGSNFFPGTTVTTPDCTHAAGLGTLGAARLDCAVAIPSYNILGRVDPRTPTYTITARATDAAANGGAPLTDEDTWSVKPIDTVTPAITNTDPTVAAQGVSNVTNSYIALQSASTSPTVGPVAEGTDVVFSVLVNDSERDKFYIQIDRCLDVGCTTTDAVMGQTLVSRNADALGKRYTFNYNLAQDTVTAAAAAAVTYRVTVIDKLPDYDSNIGTPDLGNPVTMDMTLNVTNSNPAPAWAGAAGANPTLVAPLTVMAGMPITIDPGTITDTSTEDGAVIQYQWDISIDAGVSWTPITGATSRILKWTPGNSIGGTNVRLRLCLGDDGFGNELANCSGIAAPPVATYAGIWTGITAKANSFAKNSAFAANGSVASWYDSTEREYYMVYSHRAGADDSYIYIEKYDVATNGTISHVKTISFPTEQIAPYYDTVTDSLSVVGQTTTVGARTYRNLYVSYVTQSDTAPSPPQMRVRQVDLTDDDMIFSYSGVYESNSSTANLAVLEGAAGAVTITMQNNTFDAGEYIALNGIVLTPVAVGTVADDCEFEGDNTLTTDQILTNISTAYTTCATNTADARNFSPNGAPAGSVWAITNFPRNWVNMANALTLGKAGSIMLHSSALVIPFLSNTNGGKLSTVSMGTTTPFLSGSLGKSTGSYSVTPTTTNFNTTVSSNELANSYGNSGTFDVAVITPANVLNSYRFSVAGTTVTLLSSVLNIFSGELVHKPRIATGNSATNNHVFILTEDTTSATKELFFARINAATYALAPTMPVIPFDATHEQYANLTNYKIRALSGNKKAVVAVQTDDGAAAGDVLLSIIKPVAAASDVPTIRPVAGAVYPKLADSVSNTVGALGLSVPFTFTVGSAGATASENAKESVVLLHPSAAGTGYSASFINVTEETISATAIGGASQFTPPFIK